MWVQMRSILRFCRSKKDVTAGRLYAVGVTVASISAFTLPAVHVTNLAYGQSDLSMWIARAAAGGFAIILGISLIGWLISEIRRSWNN